MKMFLRGYRIPLYTGIKRHNFYRDINYHQKVDQLFLNIEIKSNQIFFLKFKRQLYIFIFIYFYLSFYSKTYFYKLSINLWLSLYRSNILETQQCLETLFAI